MNKYLLLDTHIWIWFIQGSINIKDKDISLITEKANKGKLLLSSISLWEIGMLISKQRIVINKPALEFVEQAAKLEGMTIIDITPRIAIDSSSLPNNFHGDPSDRIIVASARIMNAELMTYDQKIIDYAKSGHVNLSKI